MVKDKPMQTVFTGHCKLFAHSKISLIKNMAAQPNTPNSLADCIQQEAAALAADLAYNENKAHRLNYEAFVRAMKAQINDKTGAFL